MTIKKLTRQYTDPEIFETLDPLVQKWFKQKFKTFSPPQRFSVMSIHRKENTLISAPTGSGKTLSAFLSILNELIILSKKGELKDQIYCVYCSPLKALNNDIQKNLEEPLRELNELAGKDLGIRVAVRTGDTSQYERSKMMKNPPHILITTPETLSIILVAPKFREHLRFVQWSIVDEIHALAVNKRGVHLSLSLERLVNLAGNFTRIGLSATISPIEDIARFLVGWQNGEERDCQLVDVSFLKKLDIKVISPVENIIDATEHEIHEALYKLLDQLITSHKTTLIFTNTRSATERVVHHLKDKFPEKYTEDIGAHHSSLSKEHRLDIENRLKEGKLKAVVSSTSLELGIDIGYIDLVILLTSPKSVSRALQRFGRSGHQLHDKVKGRFIVMDRDDLVECSLILKNAIEGKIDNVQIPRNCLDVLAQQIYGMAIEDQQHVDTVYDLVKRSHCYKDLLRGDFDDVIRYLSGDYPHLESRNVYAKIWHDKDTKMIGRRGKMARVLYSTNIGTIPDESFVSVKVKERSIGKIDEAFLERMKPGDIFVLGGNTYRFNFARGMTIQVTPTPGRLPTVPSWFSEMLPLSFDVAMEIQRFRGLINHMMEEKAKKEDITAFIHSYLYVDDNAANSIYEYIRDQFHYAEVSHNKKMVIEFYHGYSDKRYVIFHSLYGRRINDVLSRAIAYELSKIKKKNVAINLTDTGFYLTADAQKMQVLRALQSLHSENLEELMGLAIDKTEVLKRRFRHCAGRSLMILRTYKGQKKHVGRQQVSAQILISAAKRISEDFPILKEARREVLEDLMDIKNAKKILEQMEKGKIQIKIIATDIPSPFALNLVARGYTDILKMEDRLEFIRRMHKAVRDRVSNYVD
ncbi:MAG: ATP-dependent helicase [archaeon]